MSVSQCLYQPILVLLVVEVNMSENRPKREDSMSEVLKKQEMHNSVM